MRKTLKKIDLVSSLDIGISVTLLRNLCFRCVRVRYNHCRIMQEASSFCSKVSKSCRVSLGLLGGAWTCEFGLILVAILPELPLAARR